MKKKPENAQRIRYIKLGSEALHWARCKEQGLIWIGFDTGTQQVNQAASNDRWEKIYKYWQVRCKTPRHHTNQTKEFFDDSGDTLWVTFEDGCLFYAYSDGKSPIADASGDPRGCVRRTDSSGWRNVDAKGRELRLDGLSGRLTKTAGYRQTICGFSADVERYLRRCLAAEENPAVSKFSKNREAVIRDLEELIKSLTWQDFEVLIELVFVQSGMRRMSRTGGTKKTTDIDLKNPITSETAFVQVKSSTTQSQLDEYIKRKSAEKSDVDRMYYVFHTGKADTKLLDVTVWNCRDVAARVFETGLSDWVVSKSK